MSIPLIQLPKMNIWGKIGRISKIFANFVPKSTYL